MDRVNINGVWYVGEERRRIERSATRPACEYRHCIHQRAGKCTRPEPPSITIYSHGHGRCHSTEEA